ncbi:hypothetical protein [Bosea sp. PAMC 26642]|uniref:hypothetical protein n=1 Tax=Bosea sp. (strain PAMC 26642) TaxID=1792307 RepID=UPI0012E8A786|nr:hypothetical protein [Bosea sp. PAMC 26642]
MTPASTTPASTTPASATPSFLQRAAAKDMAKDAGPGEAGGLVQAPGRRFVLEATGLEARAGFSLRDGALSNDSRIAAHARLPLDTLGRDGLLDTAGELPLAIRPLPEGGAAGRILLVLAHGGQEPDFHATLWLPPEVFAVLTRDLHAGRAGRLTVSATTSLWLDAAERDAPASRAVAWKLGRDDERGTAPARGLVERIEWSAAPPAPAPIAPPAPEDPEETVAEAVGRLNWSLKQIVLVLIFLMIIAALK